MGDLLIPLLAGLSMFLGDVLQALYVLLLDRGKPGLAGLADGLSDVTQVVSIGGGATTIYAHRVGWVTALTLGLILIGSWRGSITGDRLADRFTPVSKRRVLGQLPRVDTGETGSRDGITTIVAREAPPTP